MTLYDYLGRWVLVPIGIIGPLYTTPCEYHTTWRRPVYSGCTLFYYGSDFCSMPGDEQETVTRQDLTEFRSFLLEQLKSHTTELSSKFEKASTDAECALSVSKQLKVESELKFSYPGNERNSKFNLEVLDHLENVSKALLVQDSAKASLPLNDSMQLIKERNRKIRIADSSEGGWLTVKHYESNAVALD